MIKFNQNAWLKPYTDMNIDLRRKAKSNFEKRFFKLTNNEYFGKNMENVRKHWDISLVTTEREMNYLVSEPYYHTTKFLTEILMNKPVYLELSILELSAILMYKSWYDWVKPKYCEKSRLCDTDTDSFIVYIKGYYIYKDIAEDVEIRFDTLNYELNRPFLKGKDVKIIVLMKYELGGKIKTQFVILRAKTYSWLIDHVSENKKAKGRKKCVIKKTT